MQRVHRRRNQVYQDKDFQIQSLNSLVKNARERTFEMIDTDFSDQKSIHLPLHTLTERITESLQQMHHHLSSLLMQKLGPDARNVIAAERARQSRAENERLRYPLRKQERDADPIAAYVTEIAQQDKDELELLNEYRERYAVILAELQIAKDRLVEYEKSVQDHMDNGLQGTLNKDIEELSGQGGGTARVKRKGKLRRQSTGSSGFASDDSLRGESSHETKWRKMWD